MNIGLIGYGKMGKAIEQTAVERGHTIVFKANSSSPIDSETLKQADVAIEFSIPQLAVEHIDFAIENEVPIVVGTTAWQEKLDYVTERVNKKNGTLIHASNFSIGVNIFFEINAKLAQLMNKQTDYTTSIEEIHHLQKLDHPSGTAITIANDILQNNDRYYSWKCGEENVPEVNSKQLSVTSYRKPNVPGTHTVKYTSEIDEITISHEAFNRKGFALGAVIAAEWILGKNGVFTMKDVLK